MKIGKNSILEKKICVRDRFELENIIYDRINDVMFQHVPIKGEKVVDLNDLDVSYIRDFSHLFTHILQINNGRHVLNFNVSDWDVSNANNMRYMFNDISRFKCDLSNWDIKNVMNADGMFAGCKEMFNTALVFKILKNWEVINPIFSKSYVILGV